MTLHNVKTGKFIVPLCEWLLTLVFVGSIYLGMRIFPVVFKTVQAIRLRKPRNLNPIITSRQFFYLTWFNGL